MIRRLLPPSIKRSIRITQRYLADRKSGDYLLFAEATNEKPNMANGIVKIEQPIFYNPLAANKVFNIQLAITEIQRVTIAPNAVFSFWHIVGKPTISKGYKTGRNIIGDKLQEDIGGGLCQVSGMIYHLALTVGMEILERHNHTLDLYEETKRYTPLGTDATVVYGYKDLRFKNTTQSPIQLNLEVSDTKFKGAFVTDKTLPVYALKFERQDFDAERTIKTYRIINDQKEFINLSRYIIPK